MASPTRETLLTLSFSMVRSTSSGTYPRCVTTRCPKWNPMNAVGVEVPCSSGAVGKKDARAARRDPFGQFLGPGHRFAGLGAPPQRPAKTRSSRRHTTPLGIPVVPPV